MGFENFGVQMQGDAEIAVSPVKNVAELGSYIEEKIANKELAGVMMQHIVDEVVGWHDSLNFKSGMGLYEHGNAGVKQDLIKEFKHSPFTGEELTQEQLDQSANEALSILNLVNQAVNGRGSSELHKLATKTKNAA